MTSSTHTLPLTTKTGLDRALSLVSDVRAGEGTTAVLMLVNVFLLLICYAVIKTVREPLILLGGGAEVRSYAAAGQALLLMGFVPLYSWIASRVNRMTLITGVTLFFVACIELFAAAVAAGVPYVGVAFFIWVGIFNISLVAQFWSFANDIYRKDAGDRLFPIIMVGMTAGAPLGSFLAARLFRSGLTPQVILQVSAVLLLTTVFIYRMVNRREAHRTPAQAAAETTLPGRDGFRLVLGNRYLQLMAALVVLLNIVNTTGEYMVARLLSAHVAELAAADPAFNKQAFIGGFSGDYQFWVNVTALLLQTLVTSRLVKIAGLRGVLLALPLIALGGYGLIAAGFGFGVIRWIKTAENATDYSVMNTARQLLWLPTTREEKYKAKQAIDTFAVRTGDVVSAMVVFAGTALLPLTPSQFAMVNVALTLVWLAVAAALLTPARTYPRLAMRPCAGVAAVLVCLMLAAPAQAQESAAAGATETRSAQLAGQRAEKAANLGPYEPDALERRLAAIDRMLVSRRSVYPFIGSVFEGGGVAAGPGVRRRFAESGAFDVHAAWSARNVRAIDATVQFPVLAGGRVRFAAHANRLHAPGVPFFGEGQASFRSNRGAFVFDSTTVGGSTTVQVTTALSTGSRIDWLHVEADGRGLPRSREPLAPTYVRAGAFTQLDTRTSPGYSRSGSLLRVDISDYRQTNGSSHSFRRIDAEAQQLVPLRRDRWVLAFRALASTTDVDAGADVPYFLMPELGGSRLLRGYSSWRFRDRNRLLLTGEYRWPAGPLVDMALFVDAGKVAADRRDLTLRDLRVSHGIGVRIHTPSATVTRIELARSREGLGLLFAFGPSF